MAQATLSSRRANVGVPVARRLNRLGLYILALVLVFLFAFPVYYMAIVSLMTQRQVEMWPPLLMPLSFRWDNYSRMFTVVPMLRWFVNTFRITFLTVIGTTLSSALVGYGFARFRFPLRNFLFIITLATMMIPGQITLIPQFILFHRLGWINTYLPLVVPPFFGGGAFYIFLMRQFAMQLPRDLDEAALIDGANYPQILLHVLLPLMMPAVATVAIISFMGAWNDFMGPMIYLQSSDALTLAVGLRYWDVSAYMERSQPQFTMAMCVLMSIPCIALFFSAQNVFVRGIATTGIKG